MAEPWIRVHAQLRRKPVVGRLATALSLDPQKAMGMLVEFWGNVAAHATNGSIANVPDMLLEEWAGWRGKRGAFANWLRANHIDKEQRVNEWDDYAGALEQRRATERERLRKRREEIRGQTRDSTQGVAQQTHDVDQPTQDVATHARERNGTERNKQQDQQPLLADDAKKPRRAAPKKPVDNWIATFGDWWHANVGAVEYGRVGKDLKPAHTLHGVEKLLAGAKVYNDPTEGPPRKNFHDFASNCAFWIGLAAMPMFDSDGNETLRCKRIPTKRAPGAA